MSEAGRNQGWRRTSEGKASEIERLLEPSLADLGYAIVRVLFGGDRRPRLQLMIERLDGAPLGVEDCELASRASEALLDVDDPIADGYVLEVSSAGVDRPLTREQDFATWAGFDAKVELAEALQGRRRFQGKLLGLEEGTVRLLDEKGESFALPLGDVTKAKLLLTDALLAAYSEKPTAAVADDDEAEIRPDNSRQAGERPAGQPAGRKAKTKPKKT